MAVKPSKIWYEALMVLLGRESPERFMISLFMLVLGDLLLTKEVLSMDLIYFPDGMFLPVIFILAVMAVAGPVLSALYFKNESPKGKMEDWSSRYIATMIMDMFLTPSLGVIVMSFIVQEWMPNINDITYLIFLPIILLGVSFVTLHVMNEGIKATIDQWKKVKGELDDAQKELKN